MWVKYGKYGKNWLAAFQERNTKLLRLMLVKKNVLPKGEILQSTETLPLNQALYVLQTYFRISL